MKFVSFAVAVTLAMLAPLCVSAQEAAAPTEIQLKLYEEGASAFGAGEFEKAVRLFRASNDLGPLNVTYLNLGRALYRLGRCDEARDALDAARTAPQVAEPTPAAVLDKIVEYSLDLADCRPTKDEVAAGIEEPAPAVVGPAEAAVVPADGAGPIPDTQPTVTQPSRPLPTGPPEQGSDAGPPVVVEVKLAALASGSGELEGGCTGPCEGVALASEDADDGSGFGLGLDVLARVLPSVYLDFGLLYAPSTEWDANVDGFTQLGSDLSLHAGVVYRHRVSNRLTVDGRLVLGGLILLPGDDLEDLIDEQANQCANADCAVDEGPYFGLTGSGGAGVTYQLGALGLNGGLSVQYLDITLHRLRVGDSTLLTSYSGTRVWLYAGASL